MSFISATKMVIKASGMMIKASGVMIKAMIEGIETWMWMALSTRIKVSVAAIVVLILMHVEIATNHRCATAFLYFGNVSVIWTQGTLSECRINGSIGILVMLDAELTFTMTNVFAGFHKVSRLPTVIHFHGHDRMMHSTMSVMATKAYFGESLIIEKRIVIKH
jgi:hypothetical protein